LEKVIASRKLDELPQLIKSLVYIEEINFNLKDFCTEMMHRGPSIVAVTNGQEGVYVAHNKTIYFYPSLPVSVVDTVGAGDAFGACFAAEIFLGSSIENALIAGITNACSVVEYEDATTGLLSRDEITRRAKSINRSLMKKFKLS
jgi:sugar/nucleoside kinase (ribokinase family)